MKGHIEPLSGILRVGGSYGEHCTYSVTLRYLNPEEVEIMGAERAPTFTEVASMKFVLALAGVKWFWISRLKQGTLRKRRYKI